MFSYKFDPRDFVTDRPREFTDRPRTEPITIKPGDEKLLISNQSPIKISIARKPAESTQELCDMINNDMDNIDLFLQLEDKVQAIKFQAEMDSIGRYTRLYLWFPEDGVPLDKWLESTPLPSGEFGEMGTIWLKDGSWIDTYEDHEGGNRVYWRVNSRPPLPERM